ncbi:MAG: hypothetical protein V3U29_06240, partial [Phycisphaeraceae bacterium]
MQHLPTLDVMQRALRARVCPICFERPPGSESLGPNQPRTCEPECPVFQSLPTLKQIAEQINDPNIGPYERAVTELICQTCQTCPTAGDYCDARTTLNCPLRRYVFEIIDALEAVAGR